MENKSASLVVVPLGKALSGIPLSLMENKYLATTVKRSEVVYSDAALYKTSIPIIRQYHVGFTSFVSLDFIKHYAGRRR